MSDRGRLFEDAFGLSILMLRLLWGNFILVDFGFAACVWCLRVFAETESDALGAALEAEAKTGLECELGFFTVNVVDEGDLLPRAVPSSARFNIAVEVLEDRRNLIFFQVLRKIANIQTHHFNFNCFFKRRLNLNIQ